MVFPAPPRLGAIASVLALALVYVPLTIGAIRAFPIWDDAWFSLLLEEKGTGAITTNWVDRPVMGTVWSLLAATDFWRAAVVAQALLWPTFGIISAVLWAILFPHMRQYAVEVRHVTRKGPLDQLIWVSRQSDGSISVAPYCLVLQRGFIPAG
jgi:hypothetical protein